VYFFNALSKLVKSALILSACHFLTKSGMSYPDGNDRCCRDNERLPPYFLKRALIRLLIFPVIIDNIDKTATRIVGHGLVGIMSKAMIGKQDLGMQGNFSDKR